MRKALIAIAAAAVSLGALAGPASASSPANARASCVATITALEATQLPPGSVGGELAVLARSLPSLGQALVSPLAQTHLGSFALCREAEE